MKRALSILLCLTLLTGVGGFPAAAADTLNVNDYYVLPESVTVDGVTITADGQIVVSDEKILSVLGDIDSAADWTSLTINNAALNVGGDVRANIPDYGTVLSVMNGSTVDIGGSIIGNINPDTFVTAIEAGSWASEDVRPSYVRVEQNVKGNIVVGGGSTVDVKGHVEGRVSASGKSTSVIISDYMRGSVGARNHATVLVNGDVISKVKAIEDDYVNYATAVIAREGGTVTVDGNISAINSDGNLGTAIDAESYPWEGYIPEGGRVEVTGDVQGQIRANYGTTIDVKGHAEGGIEASGEGTFVTIGDGVTHTSDKIPYQYGNSAVSASDYATVSVNGNVTTETKSFKDGYINQAYGIIVRNGGTVTVDGNVSAINSDGSLGTGIDARYYSTVDVKGHAEGSVKAQGEGTSVSIGDSLEGRIEASNNATVSVTGDVINKANAFRDGLVAIATAISVRDGASVTVDGDVSAINSNGRPGTAINANGYLIIDEVPEASHVEVTGDAVGDIHAGYGSIVDVQGHVEGIINAWGEGTKVTIGDGVTTPYNLYGPAAIDAHSHAEVDVTGDVDGTIYASWGGKVDVTGNTKQIYISNPTLSTVISDDIDLGSTVRVGGDVSDGVFISMYGDGTDQNNLTVEGTISSERDAITLNVRPHVVMDIPQPTYPWQGDYSDDDTYQKALEEYRQAQEDYWARENELYNQAREKMNTAEGVQTIIDNLPQIIVGTLAPEADFVLVNGMMNPDNQQKITEALLSQINYIVNMEGVDTANIAVYGYEELDGYLVAREQQKLTVKCINDNMVIANVSAGRYATIDANADGSYTITVQRGGDLNLVVTARPKALPVSMNSGGGTENSGTNSACDEAQWSGWLSNLTADYAMRTLTLDLTGVLTTDIPYETLRAYLADYGIDTLIVITGNAEYTMSIAEVLALSEDGSTVTFTARDGALELAVNGSVVSTFSVE